MNSTITLKNSLFYGNNLTYSNCMEDNCNITTIYAYLSDVFLNNVTFQNSQFPSNFLQYELSIYESKVLQINNSQFINDLYYSIYAKNIENVLILFSNFEIQNTSLKQKYNVSGIIKIIIQEPLNSTLKVNSCRFLNLGSEISESSITYEKFGGDEHGKIEILNSTFNNNIAAQGGAINFNGLTNIFVKNSVFVLNRAENKNEGLGGSIYSFCEKNCYISFENTELRENSAKVLGGGIFSKNSKISHMNMMKFDNNVAVLINDRNNSNMTSPLFINITYLKFSRGESIRFDEFNQTHTISINNNQEMLIRLEIYDSENTKCTYFNGTATLTAVDQTVSIKENRVIVSNGTIEYTKFGFNGNINKTYQVDIEVTGIFDMKSTLSFYVRPCLSGEYFEKSLQTCIPCPFGTFSLDPPKTLSTSPFSQENITICRDCPDNSECEGNKIVPNVNYWINSSLYTTKIVECPLDSSCVFKILAHSANLWNVGKVILDLYVWFVLMDIPKKAFIVIV